jgi:tRNA dimethylallyltransferase
MSKTCIIVLGPTAIGKTSIGIELAKHFATEIISADSRQCYKELNIGVAKPSIAELQQVPHYFINSHSIKDNVNAAVFESYALSKVSKIFEQHEIAIMVGGTGLYIKAFCEGIDLIPTIEPGTREQIVAAYEVKGLTWLQDEVKKHDPLFYANGEIKNPHRLMRALEVVLSTGRSVLSFHKNQESKRDFNIIKIGLDLPRDELYSRINMRVDMMMNEGLLSEVQRLTTYQHLNALQTVGYKELFSYLREEISLSQAVEAIKMNTRHYAKRQLTWFKKDPSIQWCSPEFSEVMQALTGILKNKQPVK